MKGNFDLYVWSSDKMVHYWIAAWSTTTILNMKSTSYHLATIINLNIKVEADIKSRDSVCAARTLWTRWPQNPCIMVCKSTSFWSTDHHYVNDHWQSILGFGKPYMYQVFFHHLFCNRNSHFSNGIHDGVFLMITKKGASGISKWKSLDHYCRIRKL